MSNLCLAAVGGGLRAGARCPCGPGYAWRCCGCSGLFLQKLPVAFRRLDLSAVFLPVANQGLLSNVKLVVNAVKPCVIVRVSLGVNFSALIDCYGFAEDPFES